MGEDVGGEDKEERVVDIGEDLWKRKACSSNRMCCEIYMRLVLR